MCTTRMMQLCTFSFAEFLSNGAIFKGDSFGSFGQISTLMPQKT